MRNRVTHLAVETSKGKTPSSLWSYLTYLCCAISFLLLSFSLISGVTFSILVAILLSLVFCLILNITQETKKSHSAIVIPHILFWQYFLAGSL